MKKRLLATIPVLLVVFLCSTFTVFADTIEVNERYAVSDNSQLDGKFAININGLVNKPYIVGMDYDFVTDRAYYGSSSNPYPSSPFQWNSNSFTFFYDIPVDITVSFSNSADYLAYGSNNYIGITPTFNFDVQPNCYYYELLSDDVELYNVTSNGEFRFRMVNQQLTYMGRPAISRGGSWSLTFRIHFLYYYAYGMQNGTTYPQIYGTSMNQSDYVDITNITVGGPQTWLLSNVDAYANENITLWQIKQNILNILDKLSNHDNAYNSVTNESSAIESESNSLENQSDTIHNQENSYYTQVNTALTDTGLNNYTFSANEVSGINVAKGHFMLIWNILDDYRNVFIFSMTLSLALMIIRHIRPIKRKKEEAS